MKINKLHSIKHKLIKLEFIRSKILQKFDFINNLSYLESYLKKALLVIFQYHFNNKRILFIGIPQKTQNKLKKTLKTTKHLFLSESYWIKGLLTNKTIVFKYLKNRMKILTNNKTKTDEFKKYFLLNKKPNLVVVFNAKSNISAIDEANKLNIPVVALNSELAYGNRILYDVPGNYKFLNKKNNNFIYLLLNSIFKKQKLFNVKKNNKTK